MSINQMPSFRLEINTLPVINGASVFISSPKFVYGGCQWMVGVYPKVNIDHWSLYMSVANRKSLPTGWKRSAYFYFVIFNQSEKELYRSPSVTNRLFCAENPTWGYSFANALPLSKIQEEGEKLIIEVYINVVEEGGDESEKTNKTVDINGFQVLDSQARVQQLEERVKDLEVMELGFKLNSLETKLMEVSLEKKELELRVLKKIEEVSLERNITDYQDRSRVQQLEESVEFLLTVVSDLKLELDKKKNKSYDDGFMLVDELDH